MNKNKSKYLVSTIILKAKKDYRGTRKALTKIDIEEYLKSSEFEFHCDFIKIDPEITRKDILSQKTCRTLKPVSLRVLANALNFDFNEAFVWCVKTGNVLDVDNKKLFLSYLQCKKLMEWING